MMERDKMSSDMAVEVWRELSEDLVYAILSYLPERDLCKLRTVCKSWNTTICSPEFRALRVQHDAGFVVARHAIWWKDDEDGEDEGFGWSFLDLDPDKRQWRTIIGDEQAIFDGFAFGTHGAMHGGLVCQRLYGDDTDVAIFVSNPLQKTSRRLPPPPFHSTCESRVAVNMVCTDTIAEKYKIFLMHGGIERALGLGTSNPLLVVYDSTTNEWRTSRSPIPQRTSRVDQNRNADWCGVESSVMWGEMLYVLVSPNVDEEKEHWLWRYSHVTDAWMDTEVIFDEHLCNPQLIVSDNRLFLGARVPFPPEISDELVRKSWGVFPYEISEVLLAQRTRRAVFTAKGPEVAQMFNWDEVERVVRVDGDLDAYGYGKFITVFDSVSGNSIVYDPVKSSWDKLPTHPFVARLVESEVTMWYGNAMNLIGNFNLPAG